MEIFTENNLVTTIPWRIKVSGFLFFINFYTVEAILGSHSPYEPDISCYYDLADTVWRELRASRASSS